MASVEQTIRSEFQTADRFFGDLGACPVSRTHAINGRGFHITKIDVAVFVRAQRIREAKIISGDFPCLAGNQQVQEREITPEISASVEHGCVSLLAPQPRHCLGEFRTAEIGVVSVAFGPIEAGVIAHVFDRRCHLLIGPWPASECIVNVATGIRHIDTDRLWFRLAKQRGIDVAASEIGKAADARIHALEKVGSFPRRRKRTDSSGAGTADRVHRRIVRNGVTLADFRNDFFEEKADVTVTETIVFQTSIRMFAVVSRFRLVMPWIDEDGNRWRHVAACD